MAIFTATLNAVGATAAQDVFEIVAPATAQVLIHDIKLGQYTDFGDAAAEILSVLVIRGHGTTGSGGSAVTPTNLKSYGPAAGATVAANNTTVATGGTAKTLIADVFNIQAGWSLKDALWMPRSPEHRELGITLDAGERLVVRITAPADSITMNATLVFEELPKRVLS